MGLSVFIISEISEEVKGALWGFPVTRKPTLIYYNTCSYHCDLAWPSTITRLTAHLTCGLTSDLMICKH